MPTAVNFGEVVSLQAASALAIVLLLLSERFVFPNAARSWATETITGFLEWISLDLLLSHSGICIGFRMGVVCFLGAIIWEATPGI